MNLNYLTLSALLCCIAFSKPARAQDEDPEAPARKKFIAAYTTAKTAEAVLEAMTILKGLKETASLRLLVGMLGNKHEIVRVAACKTLAEADDPLGFTIKPLTGALGDSATPVRVAAAEALSHTKLKADAIKALAFAINSTASEVATTEKKRELNEQYIVALNRALEKLSGAKTEETHPLKLGAFWMEYWRKHQDELRAADDKLLPAAPPVLERRKDLPPDSLDKAP
jgi:HEAT repeat protein